MKEIGLHYEWDVKLPGGITQPRLIDIVNEKLDLIDRLINLYERVGTYGDSKEERDILKNLRRIELNAINTIILTVDGNSEKKTEKIVDMNTEGYSKTMDDLSKHWEKLLEDFNKTLKNSSTLDELLGTKKATK
jgi:hypothetical protein